ncbi:MAG: hypothetical protein NWT00_07395 [Beijerinckiaceae bacterium]|nr:hypothetical protein [Beijerinckiaceae bacterium]
MHRAQRLPGYAGTSYGNNLQSWPILTKSQILGRERDFAEHSFYPAPYAETGGTTGEPLRVARSISTIAFEQALVDHLCAQMGINARTARVAMLKGDFIDPSQIEKHQFWSDTGSKKRIYSSLHISPETAEVYRQSLLDFAPDILFCYPSSVDTLVKYLGQDSGVRIPLVFSSSEVLHDEARVRVRQALYCNVIDLYGHAERLAAAYSINGGGYCFLPSYGHVELIPVGDGLARIIATTLRPGGQIFIRYDTGDLAQVPSQDPAILEQIGLGLIPFNGIVGRDSEFVDLPDGRRIFSLNQIPRGADGANTVQLHYNGSDAVDIYIVPGNQFNVRTCERIQENFYRKFPESITANIWKVATPVREPNGKAPVLLRDPQLPQQRAAVCQWLQMPKLAGSFEADTFSSGNAKIQQEKSKTAA